MTNSRAIAILFSLVSLAGCCKVLAESNPVAVQSPDSNSSYVVLVSSSTWADADWRSVAHILRDKHNAALIVFDDQLDSTLPELRRIMPRYTCLVAKPDEAGRSVVVTMHRMLRKLDDDPYTDTIWAILTGYDASDAKRIASRQEPLIVKRLLSGTGAIGLGAFQEGIKYSEARAGGRWVKRAGKEEVQEDFPVDSTKGLVDGFNEFKPDMFVTSGHATEHDWRIGYSYKDGSFRCEDGNLFGVDTNGVRHPINSPNSKVYLAVGNCLIAHIPDRDCMALAFMHSAGVDQMMGYTAVTFFGFMGWGTKDYFESQRGRFTLAESFYVNNQSLMKVLLDEYPRKAETIIDFYDHERIEELAAKLKIEDERLFGLLWDRDVVALYGDPAWQARREVGDLPWSQEYKSEGDTHQLTIIANRVGKWNSKPIFQLLPNRIGEARITQGEGYAPVITDDFILVTPRGECKQGDKVEIVFTAKTLEPITTSAEMSPIRASSVPKSDKRAVDDPATLPAGVPQEYSDAVSQALTRAGGNSKQIRQAIENAREGYRPAVCFLIANMPDQDLKTLSSEYLLENVGLAFEAVATAPWGDSIPDDLFLNYVLPYAVVNETRDNWRPMLREKCKAFVEGDTNSSDATHHLNSRLFKEFNVRYHATKRTKPDQSPLETIELGYASCTGLSILLVDACRAVGVPARFVGVPQWTGKPGNHSWVEIWDGQWHVVGAAEPNAAGLDRVWFSGAASKADVSKIMHRIYAASFKRTNDRFPLVWAPSINWVHAVDVSRCYTDPVRATIKFFGGPKDDNPSGSFEIKWHDESFVTGQVTQTDQHAIIDGLPGVEEMKISFKRPDGKTVNRTFVLDTDKEQTIKIEVSDLSADARHYQCGFIETAPAIDGRLDDACWREVPWSERFVDILGVDAPLPRYSTRMKMAWNRDYLFVAAEMEERHVWATLEQHDQIVFHDNDFEIFIDPNGDGREYYEIEVNPLNTIFDLFLVRTYRNGGPALHDWDMRNLQSAIHVDGTLNDSSDQDTGWTVEFALPWRSLAEAARRAAPPKPGDVWRMNFSRVEWKHEIKQGQYVKVPDTPEDNWVWSPQGEINMHKIDTWGYVHFVHE